MVACMCDYVRMHFARANIGEGGERERERVWWWLFKREIEVKLITESQRHAFVHPESIGGAKVYCERLKNGAPCKQRRGREEEEEG